MPDRNNRTPGNVPGAYYVDDTCIDCDLCRDAAPDLFGRDDVSGLSFVRRQPSNSAETALAEEARTLCPLECIGNDGA
jgi:ferredoxin